jgi:class 3 adenylate cyclase
VHIVCQEPLDGIIDGNRLVSRKWSSHGEPSRVHVSQATHDLLAATFRFAERGPITIKGKGTQTTYFLLGRK